jgi:hypothetical protein
MSGPIPPKPETLTVNPEGIATELLPLRRWVPWLYKWRAGRNGKPGQWAKVPCQINGEPARSNDAATWGDFDPAFLEYSRSHEKWAGIGFMLGEPFAGIDLDGVFDGKAGCYVPWPRSLHEKFAQPEQVPDPGKIVCRLRTYAEVSPSGKGVKAIVRATLPPGGRKIGDKTAGLEVYESGRFFALTGHVAPGSEQTIAEAGAVVAELHAAIFGHSEAARTNHHHAGCRPSDEQILDRACRARNGDKLGRLLTGDPSGYSSPSEADAALACLLAFWTKDPGQIGRLIRQSGLNRDKYDRRDYLPRTISRAFQQVTDSYEWSPAIEKHRDRAEKDGEEPRQPECDLGSPEAAIQAALPNARRPLNKLVFVLARALKAVPELADGPADAAEEHVRRWHRLSTEAGMIDASFDDCRIAFLQRWSKVKFPLGAEPMSIIFRKACTAPLPKCAERYDSEPVRLLVRLCRELQKAKDEANDEPFCLTCAEAGRLLDLDTSTAWRYLWLLQNDGIIQVVEKGHQGRATRFRYRGD